MTGGRSAPGPRAPPRSVRDRPAAAGRDCHAAGSPGHPVRWADCRRAALERAARDHAGRPRGRRGPPARRAPPRAHRRDDRPHRAAQAVRKAGPGDPSARSARADGPRPLRAGPVGLRPRGPTVQRPDAAAVDAGTVRCQGCGDWSEPGRAGRASAPLVPGTWSGVGLLTGIGYASLMPGRESSLEPGDTFEITVGTLSYRPLAPSPPLSLYPAPDPAKRTKEHGR